jgi:hypothetical protein
VAGLAGHLESDAIGSGVLELKGGGREVVEILVKELEREKRHKKRCRASAFNVPNQCPVSLLTRKLR